MLKIEGVSKSYGRVSAIKNISMKVERGSIHGLIGENGSGKTTLIKCITGIYRPDAGTVLVDGQPVFDNPGVKAQMGYVADRNPYFPYYTVSGMADFFAGVYDSFDLNAFKEYNEIFQLPEERRLRKLSKGQSMRLALMLNLAARPELLILDEPTSGLDPLAKKQFADFLIQEADNRGMTVFISSHHLHDLETLCDHMTMLKSGEVQCQDTMDGVKNMVTKLQVAFPDGAPAGFYDWEELIDVKNIGSIYQIVTKGYDEKLHDKLIQAGAALVEEIPVSLEDAFIYTHRGERG